MTLDVPGLLKVLDLEQIEANIFRGFVPDTGRKRVFGGLVVGQALAAAARTVDKERPPHSMHAYFVLPGDPSMPIVYQVERVRDGRSFATRRCVAIQAGRPIFDLFASFQNEESGLDHQHTMPDVPQPEDLLSPLEIVARDPGGLPDRLKSLFSNEQAIEIRPCDPNRYSATAKPSTVQNYWVRTAGPLPDDPAVHRAVLAYLSDMTLLDVTFAAHGRTLFEPGFITASLDHALWFHRPFRADEWMLYAQDSPNTSGARGLARGSLFTREGILAASVTQEGLIRPANPAGPSQA